MSTTAIPRHKFFVYAPDKVEEGTFEKRLSVRPKHVETAKSRIEAGFIRRRPSANCGWRNGLTGSGRSCRSNVDPRIDPDIGQEDGRIGVYL